MKPRATVGAAALAVVCAIAAIVVAPANAAPGGAGSAPDGTSRPVDPPARGTSSFDRHGMWIWYVERSDGGSVPGIVARARRAGIGTLYIKAGDAGNYWGQFSTSLVRRLRRAGLDVCAWQFVYGDRPLAEARVGAAAVRRGADCLVIDAEGQYEGKYAAADRYVRALRARIGPTFPLSLSSFPYVDYHPSFPYSVFLGPGGAAYNQPQMYWKAIGTSVRAVYEHTYLFNRLWKRPVYPIGQTYLNPGHRSIRRFRRFAQTYGGRAPSWWSWQETNASEWRAVGASTAGPVRRHRPVMSHPTQKRGSRGDLVVWAQSHLRTAVRPGLPITGIFGRRTRAAVRAFQRDRGLRADGVIGTATWEELLEVDPVRPLWGGRRRGAGASAAVPARRPLSASLPARAYEVDPGPGP